MGGERALTSAPQGTAPGDAEGATPAGGLDPPVDWLAPRRAARENQKKSTRRRGEGQQSGPRGQTRTTPPPPPAYEAKSFHCPGALHGLVVCLGNEPQPLSPWTLTSKITCTGRSRKHKNQLGIKRLCIQPNPTPNHPPV